MLSGEIGLADQFSPLRRARRMPRASKTRAVARELPMTQDPDLIFGDGAAWEAPTPIRESGFGQPPAVALSARRMCPRLRHRRRLPVPLAQVFASHGTVEALLLVERRASWRPWSRYETGWCCEGAAVRRATALCPDIARAIRTLRDDAGTLPSYGLRRPSHILECYPPRKPTASTTG